mgnify:FL=1
MKENGTMTNTLFGYITKESMGIDQIIQCLDDDRLRDL